MPAAPLSESSVMQFERAWRMDRVLNRKPRRCYVLKVQLKAGIAPSPGDLFEPRKTGRHLRGEHSIIVLLCHFSGGCPA